MANLGNSLAAVRQLVFETGQLSQPELAAALADDFAGLSGEQLRQRLLKAVPKYGNDVAEVDALLVRAYDSYIQALSGFHNTRHGRGPIGGGYYAGTSSISANVPFGAATAAPRTVATPGAPWPKGRARPPAPTPRGPRRCSTPSPACPPTRSWAVCCLTRS
ncbi:MAG: hypothetical protein LRY38_05000 [Aeromonadaceae bacterium]|nr:hypothetical protein [Aeromonadaceae bacterium]